MKTIRQKESPSSHEIYTFTIQVLSELSESENICKEHHLIRDLALDSLDVMDALQQIEDEFDLTIPTDILPRLQTVEDLICEIKRRINFTSGEIK